MESLSLRKSAGKHLLELLKIVVRSRALGHNEESFDDVVDVSEKNRVALRSIFVCELIRDIATDRKTAVHFIATNGGKADGSEDVNLLDHPSDRRLPQDRFENPPRGRRSH